VSVTDAGAQSPQASTRTAVSADGTRVAFVSAAGDASGTRVGVLREDLETGAVTVVSVTAAGRQKAQSIPGDPSVSFDGTRVAYRESTDATIAPALRPGTYRLRVTASAPGGRAVRTVPVIVRRRA
jgi:Tol biopolymer transport system component